MLTPSADRVEPGCGYFERCGGCHYQHIEYSAQLRYKSEILRETIRRTAKFELQQEITLHSADPWAYRIARECISAISPSLRWDIFAMALATCCR